MNRALVENDNKPGRIIRDWSDLLAEDASSLEAEAVEISEDAYKQNDVYRPWTDRAEWRSGYPG